MPTQYLQKDSKACIWFVILGYGRSGSTWLELAISAETGTHSVGELFLLKKHQSVCSCGCPVEQCKVWKHYLKLTSNQTISKLSNHDAVIDSSKSTHGALNHLIALLRSTDIQIKPIICFRNPTYVQRSTKNGSNRLLRKKVKHEKPFHWLKLIFSWQLAYVNAFLFCLVARRKPILVNFDKKNSVDSAINKALMIYDRKPIDRTNASHIIEGNRMNSEPLKKYISPQKIKKRSIPELLVFVLLSPVYILLWTYEKISRD